MSNFIVQPKLIQIAEALMCSSASVALYAEHSLNESKIHFSNHFHQRMLNINPKSLSKLSHNIHCNVNTPWNYPGGTVLTINTTIKVHMSSTVADPSGLYFCLLAMYKKIRLINNLEPTRMLFQRPRYCQAAPT